MGKSGWMTYEANRKNITKIKLWQVDERNETVSA